MYVMLLIAFFYAASACAARLRSNDFFAAKKNTRCFEAADTQALRNFSEAGRKCRREEDRPHGDSNPGSHRERVVS